MSKVSAVANRSAASSEELKAGKSGVIGRSTIAANDVRRMQRVASTKGQGHTPKNSHIARIQAQYDRQNKPK